MIDRMTKYDFILLNRDKDAFLGKLQELGVVDITRSTIPVDDRSAAMLSRAESVKKAKALLESLDSDAAEPVKVDTQDAVSRTFEENERLRELETELAAARKEHEARTAWGKFDKDTLRALEDHGYKVLFHIADKKKFSPEWASETPLQVVSENGKKVYFVTVYDGSGEFRHEGVTDIPSPEGPASETEARIASLEAEISGTKGRLLGLRDYIGDMNREYRETAVSLDRYLADAGATDAVENHVSLFEGFVPDEVAARFDKELEGTDAVWLQRSASKEDNPPIKLKNNKFTEMYRVLTDMYGRPDYDEFDPTPYISIFFMLFFAFCMGDMGYGLVILLFGFVMKKMKGMSGIAPLVKTLGVATMVIGFLFHTFFSIDISQWSWIPDWMQKIFVPSKVHVLGDDYDGTMILAILVGVVHLCVAFVVKAVYAVRKDGFVNSLGTLGWTLLIVGGVIVGAVALTGVLNKSLTKWIVIGLGCVSAVGIFLLNNVHRNPLINIGSGLYETYNTVTGLLSDVLSYLRLYALGLAGSMLGLAFNQIGLMVLGDGKSIIAWIPFLLIVIVGHTLNILMCVLGAFVHPLRLNFLEFFKNSNYDGKGRAYNPLTNNNQ